MSLLGVRGCCGLVYLGTQQYFFHHVQYRVITKINMITTVIGVNLVGIILTIWGDQWVIGIDCSFVRVVLMLKME